MKSMRKLWTWMLLMILPLGFAACSDDDEEVLAEPGIQLADGQTSLTFEWTKSEGSVKFNATAAWKATLDGTPSDWVKLSKTEGQAGDISLPFVVYENNSEFGRNLTLVLSCGDKSVSVAINQNANPDAVKFMNKADIPDFDKYICPGPWNDGFQKGPDYMLRDDAKWSWHRHAQSEHFFVFWAPEFGPDPNASTVPAAMRVNIDDLLVKAEHFYQTNVETLKMVEVGQGKSYLDDYKMQIYILYQTEWLATGAGYDNTIGALWVNQAACQPVGSTIAHEIGHSFQYQVYCDKLYQGGVDDLKSAFRYGFGPNGEGGNGFWEQCAQWQSFQDYPEQQFGSDLNVFMNQYHRHFHHEWMRYASYWLQSYWVQLHGIEAYGKIWRESVFPEDAIKTYNKIFNNGDWDKTYAELYDYAARMATFDIDGVREYSNGSQGILSTTFFKDKEGTYQVAYMSCPSTTGFNVIPLNVPEGDNKVSVTFEGLAAGSALSASDTGSYLDGDLKSHKVSQKTYNNQGAGKEGWKYGFVAMKKDGERVYGSMNEGKVGVSTASFEVPANTERLFLVVLGAPTEYSQQEWDDDCKDDDQWPYRVKFEGTDLFGNFEIDSTKDPSDVTLTYDLTCDANFDQYPINTIDLKSSQKLSQAFVMQHSDITGLLQNVGTEPTEGKIVWALEQADGSFSYTDTANGGFWCDDKGNNVGWGDNGYAYVEFSDLVITYGHYPGHTEAGKTYTVKPTLIYTKDGKQYKATIVINMQF